MHLYLTESEVRRMSAQFVPTAAKMAKVAALLKQQVADRFATQGASGGTAWPARWMGRPASNHLLSTFTASAADGSAQVASDAPGARVQQLGTRGRGGQLPDIVPVRAKALFIPLTDRARPQHGMVPTARSMLMHRRSMGLTQGRIVDGKVRPPNADFVFLKKVKVPARPVLPDSERERAAQTQAVAEALRS